MAQRFSERKLGRTWVLFFGGKARKTNVKRTKTSFSSPDRTALFAAATAKRMSNAR